MTPTDIERVQFIRREVDDFFTPKGFADALLEDSDWDDDLATLVVEIAAFVFDMNETGYEGLFHQLKMEAGHAQH